jgi:23S rRNA pseudouridine1911/1915/1917 synthase
LKSGGEYSGQPHPSEDDTGEEGEAAEGPLATFTVATAEHGERLDKMLAVRLPRLSRSRLQSWIEQGAVRVDGEPAQRARQSVQIGQRVVVHAVPAPEDLAFAPEPMTLAIVHEDADLIVLDKPPGLVVHPAAGHWSGTLLNGLLAHDPALAALPRAGIVHRLDADTSGLMVVARNLIAQTDLVRQLQVRSVTREYWAVVRGRAPQRTSIEAAIERDPRNPLRFRVGHGPAAKPARTHVARVDLANTEAGELSWVVCRLDTGRTHQIRVHLESLGLPLVGDPVYRGRPPHPRPGAAPWTGFNRQALHACRLGLVHPASGAALSWFRPPPGDMNDLMRSLGFGPLDQPIKAFE